MHQARQQLRQRPLRGKTEHTACDAAECAEQDETADQAAVDEALTCAEAFEQGGFVAQACAVTLRRQRDCRAGEQGGGEDGEVEKTLRTVERAADLGTRLVRPQSAQALGQGQFTNLLDAL